MAAQRDKETFELSQSESISSITAHYATVEPGGKQSSDKVAITESIDRRTKGSESKRDARKKKRFLYDRVRSHIGLHTQPMYDNNNKQPIPQSTKVLVCQQCAQHTHRHAPL